MRRQGQHPGRAPVAISPCPSIVLYGAGSPLLVDYEETCRRCGLEIVAIVKNIECPSCTSDPAKVLELSAASRELFDHDVAIPLFTPGNRRKAFEEVASLGAQRFRPLIDPSAILPTAVTIERGVYVNAGVVVGAACTLREFSLVNRGALLGHHLELGPFASIGPGVVLSGQVTVDRGALLGAGAVILPGIRIGSNAIVGAGAVVTEDVAAETLVVGNPARIAKANIAGRGSQVI